MGATHTVNHHEDIVSQIRILNLQVPISYVFITHSTAQYLAPVAAVAAPFAKVCSIVQTKEFPMYGTEFMAKSLTFIWELMGTGPWYGVDVDRSGMVLAKLAELLDNKTVKCHLIKKLPLNRDGLKKAHEMVESGSVIGKIGLGVDVGGTSAEEAFA